MHLRAVCTVVAVAFIFGPATGAGAQARPNFTGTWIEDEAQRKTPNAVPPAGVSAGVAPNVQTVITQTAATITIDRKWKALVRYVYDLNGKEIVNHNGANTQTTRSRWEGMKLVTEGTSFSVTSQGESNWKFRDVRWLTAKGEMAVERAHVDEDGQVNTVLQVFRRVQ